MSALSGEKDGRGIVVYTPDMMEFHTKYAGKNKPLALALDQFDLDEFSVVLPGLSEPQLATPPL